MSSVTHFTFLLAGTTGLKTGFPTAAAPLTTTAPLLTAVVPLVDGVKVEAEVEGVVAGVVDEAGVGIGLAIGRTATPAPLPLNPPLPEVEAPLEDDIVGFDPLGLPFGGADMVEWRSKEEVGSSSTILPFSLSPFDLILHLSSNHTE